MENNKLIAEFMGYTHQSDSAFKDENGFWNDFEVFETWNWLMPVIAKIVEEYGSGWSFEEGYDLDVRYKAVVNFIKECNK